MKTILFLLKKIYGNKLPKTILKSILIRNTYGKQNRVSGNILKICLQSLKLFIFPIWYLIKAKKISTQFIVFEENPHAAESRVKHIQQYNQIKSKDITIVNSSTQYYEVIDRKRIVKALWIWLQFLKAIPILLLEAKKTPVNCNYATLLNLLFVHTFTTAPNYFFYLIFKQDNYLAALLIGKHRHTNSQYFFSSADSFMYPYLRYTYLPEYELKVCNKVLVEELKYYQKLNWIQIKNATLWGPEIPIKLETFQEKDRFDIGLYSSGTWARIDGWLRTKDYIGIRNGVYLENENYKNFKEVLFFLIQFTKKNNLNFKIYAHPLERQLLQQENIRPPYFKELKTNNIILDIYDEQHSLKKIPEAKIGVSLLSTIALERWHYGYTTFANPVAFGLSKHFYGKYSDAFFNTVDELEKKLRNHINDSKLDL